jgi:hypothetical protein
MQDQNDPRLSKLMQKKEQIEKQIALKKTRIKTLERTLDTRRKILAGAYFLEVHYKDRHEELRKLLNGFLTRDQDRALFGLPPKAGAAS